MIYLDWAGLRRAKSCKEIYALLKFSGADKLKM